jgi:hypothetical protein
MCNITLQQLTQQNLPPNRLVRHPVGRINHKKLQMLILLLQYGRRVRQIDPRAIYEDYVKQWEAHSLKKSEPSPTMAENINDFLHSCYHMLCKLINLLTIFLNYINIQHFSTQSHGALFRRLVHKIIQTKYIFALYNPLRSRYSPISQWSTDAIQLVNIHLNTLQSALSTTGASSCGSSSLPFWITAITKTPIDPHQASSLPADS